MNKLETKVNRLIKEQIKIHKLRKCTCDFTVNGEIKLCYIGQYLVGLISASQVLKDLK